MSREPTTDTGTQRGAAVEQGAASESSELTEGELKSISGGINSTPIWVPTAPADDSEG